VAIFGKKDRDSAPDLSPAVPDGREPPPRADYLAPAARRDASQTTVGPSLKVKGEFVGDEDVTVEGRVEGIVSLTGGLTVGKNGVVEADVRAQSVVVHGRILGNVIAADRVEIHPSGRLEGNIKSPKISIHEGAHFKGNVDMSVTGAVAVEPREPTGAPGGAARRGPPERKP
jgi:cytoskeletal protein CcmA (bactofilin family)